MNLVDSLISSGWLKSPRIIEAFRNIKRIDFLPTGLSAKRAALTETGLADNIKDLAEANEALPIGYGQTISQPLVVAFMLELLQPKPGQKILDIGCGSGYTTALLAHVIDTGKVIGIEIVPELAEFARNNITKYGFFERKTIEIICADGSLGWKEEAPYDRILASAALNTIETNVQTKIPEAWKNQLKIGGRIVCPINNSIWLFTKKNETDFQEQEFPGFVFVPLI